MRGHAIDRQAETEPDVKDDRRRPGRQDDVSPDLIPLLRGTLPYTKDEAEEDHDPLAACRGVVIWALTSAVAWAIVLAATVLW
jgi:hypothetical protein